MDSNLLFSAIVQLLVLWLAISLHEAAHAWAAGACGDPTARDLGRATLNPLHHLDFLGSLLFPAMLLVLGVIFPVFGWGRSTPVMEEKLRHPWRDGLLVLCAGSFANLVVAGIATVALIIVAGSMGDSAQQAAIQAMVYRPGGEAVSSFPVMFTLVRLVGINVFVAMFNLIPLPPLDGGQIALRLLPPDWAERLATVRPYGFVIGVITAMIALPLLLIPFYGILSLVIQLS